MSLFEKKELEPALSERMMNIIKRSKGEEISTNPNLVTRSDDMFRYKYRIMRTLLGSEDLLRALHHETLSKETPLNGDSFKDVCIFDYLRLPDLEDKVRNYVCFEILTQEGTNRNIDVQVVIRAVSHFDDMKTDLGINRVDVLSMIISEELDWSYIFGGQTFIKATDTVDLTNKGFYFRNIVYRGTVSNNYHSMINR